MIQMGDESFCIATPAHYLGTKLEAFWNRGQIDPYITHDLEDIVSLVDGCNTLISTFVNLSQQDKSHITTKMTWIYEQTWFRDVCLGNLPSGGDTANREKIFILNWRFLCGTSD